MLLLTMQLRVGEHRSRLHPGNVRSCCAVARHIRRRSVL